ncbi:MAG: phage tail terminator-like protein, partial [Alphaproteobacteria bacterium]
MSWHDELIALTGRFATAWATAEPAVPVRWPGDPTLPPATAPWLRFTIIGGEARAVGLAADGRRLYRHRGAVAIDVLVPPDVGLARAVALADAA